MKRILLVLAMTAMLVLAHAGTTTKKVRASDPCFSSCGPANDYISQRASACYSLPGLHNFSSSCTMDVNGSPNGGYSYTCTPVYPATGGFGGGGSIHDYCSP